MKNVKKFLGIMALAVITAVVFSSCSNDMEPQTPVREGEVDVVMSTSLPQEMQSYGVNSAEGGLKNLEDKGYTVRYIMEIYPKGSTTRVQRKIKYVDITAGGAYRSTSFQTRLLASEYNFVFFADIVRKISNTPYNTPIEGLTTPYYGNRYFFSNTDESSDVLIRPTDVDTQVAGDLMTISASDAAIDTFQHPTLEMYDAYSCTEAVDLRSEPTTQSFTLRRPFAKLRLITTDADQLLATPDWSKSRVDITTSEIPTGYNALTGASVTVGNRGYWNGGIQALNSDVYSNEAENSSEKTLSVFYLPVPAKAQNLTFSISVKDASGNYLAQGIQIEVENVPLVGNKLTTIKGNLLSKNATINVTIDDEFEDDETIIEYGKEASTEDELKSKLTGKSESITFTGNVTKDKGFTLDFTNLTRSTPIYAEGNTSVLTLNIPNIQEGSVITIIGTSNAPANVVLNTGKKCSIRANLPNSKLGIKGESYKYLVYNCLLSEYPKTCSVDAFMLVDNGKAGDFFTSNDAHTLLLNNDFTLADMTCNSLTGHTCDFMDKFTSGQNIWDFVGNSNN